MNSQFSSRRVPIPARLVVLVGSLLGFSVVGCGGSSPDLPDVAPVSGIVLYQDKPVNQALVTFVPQGPGDPAIGRTQENGRFVLTTYRDKDGAVPGVHIVTVQLAPEGGLPGFEAETTGATPLPQNFADPSKTPLSATVEAGKPNDVRLVLEDK